MESSQNWKAVNARLSRFIRARRIKLGLTQEKLAELSNIDTTHIQNLERISKLKDPKLSTIIKIAKALNMSVSDVISSILDV